jgi:hypothetical protein
MLTSHYESATVKDDWDSYFPVGKTVQLSNLAGTSTNTHAMSNTFRWTFLVDDNTVITTVDVG